MVGAAGAVPEGVLGGDDVDVVLDEALKRAVVVREGAVDELDHLGDAEGEEEGVGSTWVPRSDSGCRLLRRHRLQRLDEPTLGRVDVLARAVVHQRRLALLVHVNFEPILHLCVTPVPQLSNGLLLTNRFIKIIYIFRL